MLDKSRVAAPNVEMGFGVCAGQPEVIVVISCRNYANFVADAIMSVARQTYSRLRCVVVNDASTDDSDRVIQRSIAELSDPRFSIINLSENIGQLAAFRLALRDTSGHFVAFLDADDYWFPRFLETHMRTHLNSVRSAPLSGCDALVVDTNGVALEGTFSSLAKPRPQAKEFAGHVLPDNVYPELKNDHVIFGAAEALLAFYMPRTEPGWHWVNTSTMVFRRDFIDIAIPADGEPRERHADYLLAYLAQMLGGSLILPEPLAAYRMHRGNLFANLPRVGGEQITGTEPPGALRYVHERLVLHVLRNWTVFVALAGAETLAFGLRRFMPWRELDGFAARNAIDSRVRLALRRGLKLARVNTRSGLERFAIKHLGF